MTAIRCKAVLSWRFPARFSRTRPAVARPDRDRGGAGEHGEGGLGAEPVDAGGLPDDLRSGQRPAAGDSEQHRGGLVDRDGDAPVQGLDLRGSSRDVVQDIDRDLGDQAVDGQPARRAGRR